MTRYATLVLCISTILGPCVLAPACGPYGLDPSDLAKLAVHGDTPISDAAIQQLRALGPGGVQHVVDANADITPDSPRWERYCHAIDRVGAQRDNHAARLYWHTDLERAKAVATSTDKPILSLRLLGRLDEDLSCANSRFFRTALYANEQISKELRENFVLHWQAERPAPEITIDFGDGRKLVRTVTGNSVHYLVDAQGRPLDALPGLHGPGAFHRWLRRSIASVSSPTPNAIEASRVTIAKGRVETPVLSTLLPTTAPASVIEDCRLDASSRALMATKRSCVEGDMETMIENFERDLALDTVRNRQLHATIREWFARGEVGGELESLNTRIYTELFLTPADDPWLGLLPANTYAALDHDGIVRD